MDYSDDPRHPSARNRRTLYIALAVIVLAVIVLLANVAMSFMMNREDGSSGKSDKARGSKSGSKVGRPYEVSVGELREFGGSASVPVYWAGDEKGTRLELTRTEGREVYVRYLTGKAKAGDKEPLYLTVGSYPTNNAYKALDDQKKDAGVLTEEAPGGGIVLHRKSELNAYLAYPGQDVVVEVYAPQPGKALRLITEGEIGVVR